MSSWLSNDVAIVTGGASGNGRAISLKLAEYGADVVVADLREDPREGGTATHQRIRDEYGQQSGFVECDVSTPDDFEVAVEAAREFGGVSIMVNNAGITHSNDFLETSEDEYDALMDVNVKGVFFGAQAAANEMIEHDREGAIVNISSICGMVGRGDGVRYTTSKGAVRLMTYALADSLGPRGIRVNSIHPGVVETSMTHDDLPVMESESADQYRESSPLGRVGQPEDVAGPVVFLASPLAEFVNGESIIVDGGKTNTTGGGWQD